MCSSAGVCVRACGTGVIPPSLVVAPCCAHGGARVLRVSRVIVGISVARCIWTTWVIRVIRGVAGRGGCGGGGGG